MILSFWRTPEGNEPVRELLNSMNEDDNMIIGTHLTMIAEQFPMTIPLCHPHDNGLWECRSDLSRKTIVHVLFCVSHDQIVALHGLINKTQNIPQKDINLSLNRRRSITPEGVQ